MVTVMTYFACLSILSGVLSVITHKIAPIVSG